MEEPFWPPDENVASSREERGGPPRDQPPAATHGQPVTIDPTTPAFTPTRPREEHLGSPWTQPPAQPVPRLEPGSGGNGRPAAPPGPSEPAPAPVPPAAAPIAPVPPAPAPVPPAAAPIAPVPPAQAAPQGAPRAGIYRPADPPSTQSPSRPSQAPAGPAPAPPGPASTPVDAPPPARPPQSAHMPPQSAHMPAHAAPPAHTGPPAHTAPPAPPANPDAPPAHAAPPPAAGSPYQAGPAPMTPPPAPPAPGVGPQAPGPYSPAPGVYQTPMYVPQTERPAPQVPQDWAPEGAVTAEDFARRRAARPTEPVATTGMRAVVRKSTFGLVNLGPGAREQKMRHDIEMVRRNFGGLRQVTVVNPKGGAGKTMAVLLLAMTFGQRRGGYVLAWDNNETQGTLGMRAQQDFHARTVRDLLRELDSFRGAHGRVGDLSKFVRAQGEGMFDVLASDESATAGEMLTAMAFADIREIVSRFYKLIFVDTGNNVRAENWQAAIDATDQLVVTMSARNDSAETAARMLDYLEQQGLHRLVRNAVTVVSMPPSRRELDIPAIEQHFQARTRTVLLAPYERLIDSGEPLRYSGLSSQTKDAWLKIAAAVAEGL
ncbi:MAG TPA: chromosome partitioning protein [Actinoplanes sp.]|nr:chromosome partitioning protein [Actinoplanes sp.]